MSGCRPGRVGILASTGRTAYPQFKRLAIAIGYRIALGYTHQRHHSRPWTDTSAVAELHAALSRPTNTFAIRHAPSACRRVNV
jgi:hypothetical protein